MPSRRTFLAQSGAVAAIALAPLPLRATETETRLAMPPLLDATGTGRFSLTAAEGRVNFLGQSESSTWGFNQPYLGPTLRVSNSAETQATIENTLEDSMSVHWHGLIVPGDVDGGPHQPVAPGQTWAPVLPIEQAASTAWYHSHIHGETAMQVQKGLAGVLQLTDGRDRDRGLPSDYGIDDLTLVLQDRRFDRQGRMVYDPGMHDRMMGFEGNVLLVNGQVAPVAAVPRGIVRLRLLNGSNARIYMLEMAEGRDMHLIASDNGYLDQPQALRGLSLAPGERAEILLDFSDGLDGTLISGANPNAGGMMGRAQGNDQTFPVLPMRVDTTLPAAIDTLPDQLGGALARFSEAPEVTRQIALEMRMGGMMMMLGDRFSINGNAFDMRRLDFTAQQGTVERWQVAGAMMMHPFHVHGTTFQVLSENGGPPRLQNRGWKDTILINGEAELLMRFPHTAPEHLPYMFHCHILEHEDGGMMGQFAVA